MANTEFKNLNETKISNTVSTVLGIIDDNVVQYSIENFPTSEDIDNALSGYSTNNHIHSDANNSTSGFLSASDKIKLDGVVSGATKNLSDDHLMKRENHTGNIEMSVINGLSTALGGKVNVGETWGVKNIVSGGVDLNTVTSEGIFVQPSDGNAFTGNNYPMPYGGVLLVYTVEGLSIQNYVTRNTGNTETSNRIFTRSCTNVANTLTWSHWNTFTTPDDIPALIDQSGKMDVSGGIFSGNIQVPNTVFLDVSNTNFITYTGVSQANSTHADVKMASPYGVGFGPSTNGHAVANGTMSHWFNLRNGDMNIKGNFVALGDITGTSDERLKTDIKEIKNAVDTINKLSGVTYKIINSNHVSMGLIAQKTKKAVPEVVRTNEDGYLSIAYGNLAGLFVEAVKEIDERLTKIEDRLKEMR